MGIREELGKTDLFMVRGKYSAAVNQWIVRNAIGQISQILPYICYFARRREDYTGVMEYNCRGYINSAQGYIQELRDCEEQEIANRAEELIVCAAAGLQFPER